MRSVDEWLEVLEGLDEVPLEEVLLGDLFCQGGVYVVYREGVPAYVGLTAHTLRWRLLGHEGSEDSLLGVALRAQGYGGFSLRVLESVLFPGMDLAVMEKQLIRALRPEFNRWPLVGAARTGAARREWEEREAERKRWEELAQYRQVGFSDTLVAFYRRVREAEGRGAIFNWWDEADKRARHHILDRTDCLESGEEIDVWALGREAFEVFLQVLREGGLLHEG